MQVKIFESHDMATGLRMVRNELGADALILSTRSVRNSKLGLLGKSMLEITAAIDGSPSSFNDSITPAGSQTGSHPVAPQYFSKGRPGNISTSKAQENLFSLSPSRQKARVATRDELHTKNGQQLSANNVNRELIELKGMISSLSREVASLKSTPLDNSKSEEPPVQEQMNGGGAGPIEDALVEMLSGFGISDETATIMTDLARKSLTLDEQSDLGTLSTFYQEIAAGFLQVSPPDFENSGSQKRIALVGPTGVGKTTTIAKIAAQCIGTYHKSVALITIDTYRIAAVEQLKVYGEIMGLPVEVVLTPKQFGNAIEKHLDKDVILIDTAGRSPKDTISIADLSTFFADELGIEKHLVLSAGTRDNESLEAVSHFQKLNLDRTIFTKVDECSNLGVILNTQLNNPNPLSFITNGQRVPEDLLSIDRESVARLVIPTMQGTTS